MSLYKSHLVPRENIIRFAEPVIEASTANVKDAGCREQDVALPLLNNIILLTSIMPL
jgi:hypothetical protein